MPNVKGTPTYLLGSTAVEAAGEIVLRLRVGATRWVSRLSDGKTIYAVRAAHATCGSAGSVNDSALAVDIVDKDFTAARSVRALSTEPGALLEWGPWVPLPGPVPLTFFALDDGWGYTGQDSKLRIATPHTAGTFTVIDSKAPVYEVGSRGGLVVWPGEEGAGRVFLKGWSVEHGLQTLWSTLQGADGSAGGFVNSVATSKQHLVWIAVDGQGYKFTKAQFLWSPSATTASGVAVTEGPMIPAQYGLHELRTGGDYAAAQGGYYTGAESGEGPIFVVQLSTKKLWKIAHRAGSQYSNVMAVSNDYVLVAERDDPGTSEEPSLIRRLLRFKTDQLDALEAAW